MAIFYQLHLVHDVEPDELISCAEVALELASRRDDEFRSEQVPSLVGRDTPPFNLLAKRVDDRGRETMEEWLGLSPSVCMTFRLHWEDPSAPDDDPFWKVLRVACAVMSRFPGDAVLVNNYENVWLMRRDGRVVIKDDDRVFDADTVALIPFPYERGEMPPIP